MTITAETVFNGSLTNVAVHSAFDEQEFLRLIPALDLSTGEWLRVFNAHASPPSELREQFGTTLEDQLSALAWNIHDDDPCPEAVELSKKIAALPRALKLTVLEAIERFWTTESEASSWDARLLELGLRPCASAHARLAALAYRQIVLPSDPE